MTRWLQELGRGLGRGLGLMGWLGLSGCSLLLSPPLNQLPPCVGDDCDCGDFLDQPLAQRVLEAYWGDPYNLDSDGNGLACESLPAAPPKDPPNPSDSPHLVLGNPSNGNPDNPNNYLIERQQYALAYSRDRKLPHWVSWHLDASWLGDVERQDDFRQDGSLPRGFYQVTSTDLSGSGYDRGHLIPAADRSRSAKDNSATFLMTNIIPQAPDNNRGIWRELETYTRDLVYQFDRDVYVIAGAYGEQEILGEAMITVPSRLWKVIVVLDRPDTGVNGVSDSSLVIAVDMPNQDFLKPSWQDYQTSIDSIEVATGYDLLSSLPENVEAILEGQILPVAAD